MSIGVGEPFAQKSRILNHISPSSLKEGRLRDKVQHVRGYHDNPRIQNGCLPNPCLSSGVSRRLLGVAFTDAEGVSNACPKPSRIFRIAFPFVITVFPSTLARLRRSTALA